VSALNLVGYRSNSKYPNSGHTETPGFLHRSILASIQQGFQVNEYDHKNVKRFRQHCHSIHRKQIWKMQIQSFGKVIANSFLYLIHVTAFSYGTSLVEKHEMDFSEVFRVFIVINVASMSIGRSTSSMPDYSSAKAVARRILALFKTKSNIDPYDDSGSRLVRIHSC
jgi:ABC-type multidrug transport system fused ATPase/permease subunit